MANPEIFGHTLVYSNGAQCIKPAASLSLRYHSRWWGHISALSP